MKQLTFTLIFALCGFGAPVWAQSTTVPKADTEQGFSLMEEGAKLLFRGLLANMEPALKDISGAVADLQPKLRELIAMIDDFSNYNAPELLENGDILIRRKTPAEIKLNNLPGADVEL